MTLRAQLSRTISTILTSPAWRARRRMLARRKRRRAEIHYFHEAADPYSHLAVQYLAPLAAGYDIEIIPHLVPPPDDAAAPQRAMLEAYALRDCARLAARYGICFPKTARRPDAAQITKANAALAQSLTQGLFAAGALRIGEALWRRDAPAQIAASKETTERALKEGAELRAKLGHYLGAMFHFEGEWYWGVDRLHHLEARLHEEGLTRLPRHPPIAPFQEMALDGPRAKKPVRIEFWFSFRSPYSYIAAPRLHRLAAHYGAELRWRFILPMVMRGLPVPRIKRNYIVFDVKREAEILGLPFGKIVDPVGRGAECALAVLHHAIAKGCGAQFAESGMRAAFADGIDLASDEGLQRAASRAGLTSEDVQAALADSTWRDVAEENRAALFAAGLWGAPAYRVNDMPAHWGQDRLWALEEDIKSVD